MIYLLCPHRRVIQLDRLSGSIREEATPVTPKPRQPRIKSYNIWDWKVRHDVCHVVALSRWSLACMTIALWRRCRCRPVDICQGCRVAPLSIASHGAGGRDADQEGQGLHSCMRCKCSTKPIVILACYVDVSASTVCWSSIFQRFITFLEKILSNIL